MRVRDFFLCDLLFDTFIVILYSVFCLIALLFEYICFLLTLVPPLEFITATMVRQKCQCTSTNIEYFRFEDLQKMKCGTCLLNDENARTLGSTSEESVCESQTLCAVL